MKRPPLMLALFAIAMMTSTAVAQEPTDYNTAFKKAMKGDKPLLVLITADWCPPCQVVKRNTLPFLKQQRAFKDCHWAAVNYDLDKKLAKQLIRTEGIPQLVMFEKKKGKWIRTQLEARDLLKGPAMVKAFIAQSNILRTAAATKQTTTK